MPRSPRSRRTAFRPRGARRSVLREPAKHDAAIRLAYVHDLGDTLLSLAPVVAGVLIIASGQPIFDSVVALVIAAVIVTTTIRSVLGSHQTLLWPENVVCGHRDPS